MPPRDDSEYTREYACNTEALIESGTINDLYVIAGAFATNFMNQCPALVQAWRLYARTLGKKNFHTCMAYMVHPLLDHVTAGVLYFPAFEFCKGNLLKPWHVHVARVGWTFWISWENSPYALRRCHPWDELLVGYFYDSRPDAPQLVSNLGITRAEKRAEFTIPAHDFPVEEAVHLYLIFRAESRDDFSDSLYVGKCLDGKRSWHE